MMRSKRIRKIAVLATAAMMTLSLAACGAGAEAPGNDGAAPSEGGTDQPVEVMDASFAMALPAWNAGLATIAVSEEMGFFEEEGINPEIVLLDSGTAVVQQISTGSVNSGVLTPEPVIIGHQPDQDLDAKYFMSFYTNFIYGIRVLDDSPIESIEDLRGKRIGSLALGTGAVIQLRAALIEAGIDPDTEVDIIPIGAGAAQHVATIEAGEVDAVALSDTAFAGIENAGHTLRTIPMPVEEHISSGGIAALTSELESNPELFERLGRAIAKGIVFAAANPEAAIQILFDAHPESKPAGLSDEEAISTQVHVLKARLNSMGASADMERFGDLTNEGLQANTDVLLSEGLISEDVPVDAYYTDALLDSINDFDFEAIKQQARDY